MLKIAKTVISASARNQTESVTQNFVGPTKPESGLFVHFLFKTLMSMQEGYAGVHASSTVLTNITLQVDCTLESAQTLLCSRETFL